MFSVHNWSRVVDRIYQVTKKVVSVCKGTENNFYSFKTRPNFLVTWYLLSVKKIYPRLLATLSVVTCDFENA